MSGQSFSNRNRACLEAVVALKCALSERGNESCLQRLRETVVPWLSRAPSATWSSAPAAAQEPRPAVLGVEPRGCWAKTFLGNAGNGVTRAQLRAARLDARAQLLVCVLGVYPEGCSVRKGFVTYRGTGWQLRGLQNGHNWSFSQVRVPRAAEAAGWELPGKGSQHPKSTRLGWAPALVPLTQPPQRQTCCPSPRRSAPAAFQVLAIIFFEVI